MLRGQCQKEGEGTWGLRNYVQFLPGYLVALLPVGGPAGPLGKSLLSGTRSQAGVRLTQSRRPQPWAHAAPTQPLQHAHCANLSVPDTQALGHTFCRDHVSARAPTMCRPCSRHWPLGSGPGTGGPRPDVSPSFPGHHPCLPHKLTADCLAPHLWLCGREQAP